MAATISDPRWHQASATSYLLGGIAQGGGAHDDAELASSDLSFERTWRWMRCPQKIPFQAGKPADLGTLGICSAVAVVGVAGVLFGERLTSRISSHVDQQAYYTDSQSTASPRQARGSGA